MKQHRQLHLGLSHFWKEASVVIAQKFKDVWKEKSAVLALEPDLTRLTLETFLAVRMETIPTTLTEEHKGIIQSEQRLLLKAIQEKGMFIALLMSKFLLISAQSVNIKHDSCKMNK